MVALSQLALPEVATHHRVAVLIDAIGEVLARHADGGTLPPLQVALVNEIPALQKPFYKYICTGKMVSCNFLKQRAGLRSIFRANTKNWLKSIAAKQRATAF